MVKFYVYHILEGVPIKSLTCYNKCKTANYPSKIYGL